VGDSVRKEILALINQQDAPCIIRRRIDWEPDIDYREALTEIRRLGRMGTSDLCFILNVCRATLSSWEVRGSIPNAHHGKRIEKLLAVLRSK
jgi:DNA-binding transcriptional regulator YiaG